MKESGGKPVIIKRIKKVTGGGAHGGSWKVAYADFVTAMMAFFLLMWLVSMVSPEKKAKISQYFKYYTIFDKGGWSLMAEGKGVMGTDGGNETIQKQIPVLDTQRRAMLSDIEREKLKKDLKEDIKKNLAKFKDQIMVTIHKKDIRIEIMDSEGKPIFPLGSPELNPNGKTILSVICEKIKNVANKISIEGHTDAISFASTKKMTNWELSAERANAARREIESAGVDPGRIAMVVGYAATKPIIKEDPNDERNRRICIVILGSDNASAEAGTEPDTSTVPTTIPEGVPDSFPESIDKHILSPAPLPGIVPPVIPRDNQTANKHITSPVPAPLPSIVPPMSILRDNQTAVQGGPSTNAR